MDEWSKVSSHLLLSFLGSRITFSFLLIAKMANGDYFRSLPSFFFGGTGA
jgi:hypothetical protein